MYELVSVLSYIIASIAALTFYISGKVNHSAIPNNGTTLLAQGACIPI